MRNPFFVTIVSVAIACPATAVAQGTRSADDYVCQLTGECGEAAEGEDLAKDAPAIKSPTPTGKRVSSTRGFSLSRPEPVNAAPARSGQARATAAAPTRTAKATVRRAPLKSLPQPGPARGDLSLGFETGSAILTTEAQANARAFADALNRPALAGKKVLIEGHTDRQGSRELNLDLSQRRAQAVADFLKANGVEAERLSVRGFGFDKPVSTSAEKNRRVEAVLES